VEDSVVCVNPVAGLCKVIFAAGTIAPELSVILPVMVPRSCPKASADARSSKQASLVDVNFKAPSRIPVFD
jgi:hypothetical protein